MHLNMQIFSGKPLLVVFSTVLYHGTVFSPMQMLKSGKESQAQP